MTIKSLLASVALFALTSVNATAAERLNFDPVSFRDKLAAGEHILVHVTAPWCVECRAQKPIVAALADTPEFKELVIFDLDFDTQKEALRQLNVQTQSTLITYKGKEETGRAVGITRKDAIEAAMKKAL